MLERQRRANHHCANNQPENSCSPKYDLKDEQAHCRGSIAWHGRLAHGFHERGARATYFSTIRPLWVVLRLLLRSSLWTEAQPPARGFFRGGAAGGGGCE